MIPADILPGPVDPDWSPESVAQAQALSELLPDGLVVVSGDGTIRMANTAAGRICELPLEQLQGRPLTEGLELRTPDGSLWWDVAAPFAASTTASGHREVLLMLANGREVLLTARYVRPAPGRPISQVLLGLRSAETRHRAEADHATLISTVAHELRSPLTSIKGFSATLLRRWERFTEEQRRQMIETIEADAERLTRLISELLDVSRLDAGRLRLHRQPLDLATVFRRHVDSALANGAAPERFRVHLADDVGVVWADPDRLDQILGNLVENALVHGRGVITLGAERLDEQPRPGVHPDGTDCYGIHLWVADEGSGIAPEHRRMAFTRFWQADSNRGSSGLGLYVVRGLVEAHNGRIVVTDAPGGGAQFDITLRCPPRHH